MWTSKNEYKKCYVRLLAHDSNAQPIWDTTIHIHFFSIKKNIAKTQRTLYIVYLYMTHIDEYVNEYNNIDIYVQYKIYICHTINI